MVVHAADKLAEKRSDINLNLLRASCYIHDIGRVISDENHPDESMNIVSSFLTKIGVADDQIEIINDAVVNHGVERINLAKTTEAKLLFDADKLQILSYPGFIRVWGWLVEERNMDIDEAMKFLHDYVHSTYKNLLQTDEAREIVKMELRKVDNLIESWQSWDGFEYKERKK